MRARLFEETTDAGTTGRGYFMGLLRLVTANISVSCVEMGLSVTTHRSLGAGQHTGRTQSTHPPLPVASTEISSHAFRDMVARCMP